MFLFTSPSGQQKKRGKIRSLYFCIPLIYTNNVSKTLKDSLSIYIQYIYIHTSLLIRFDSFIFSYSFYISLPFFSFLLLPDDSSREQAEVDEIRFHCTHRRPCIHKTDRQTDVLYIYTSLLLLFSPLYSKAYMSTGDVALREHEKGRDGSD